jgi:pyrroloquinoline quinone (PQQ) biosynthesis protein C
MLPFEEHPYWKRVLTGSFTLKEVMAAETQHFIRSDRGRHFRKRAAEEAAAVSSRAHELLLETYKEECTEDETGPSHVDLIKRFLALGGVDEIAISRAKPTPGNSAAIAMYKDIADRGPLHHMIGAGAVEFYYSRLSPRIFNAYTTLYPISAEQAETYRIHGPMDLEHAERALQILDEPAVQNNADGILEAVRDAFVATSLHYDGMLQAATDSLTYWDGK